MQSKECQDGAGLGEQAAQLLDVWVTRQLKLLHVWVIQQPAVLRIGWSSAVPSTAGISLLPAAPASPRRPPVSGLSRGRAPSLNHPRPYTRHPYALNPNVRPQGISACQCRDHREPVYHPQITLAPKTS